MQILIKTQAESTINITTSTGRQQQFAADALNHQRRGVSAWSVCCDTVHSAFDSQGIYLQLPCLALSKRNRMWQSWRAPLLCI